ncbi:MAG: hypothetical protein EOP87_01930 [Verrucomicrobiaceae bacterium]|nr:MAG: hypothetical protein EOP87_01930 [Verrucomicrobiaceae bacterium]
MKLRASISAALILAACVPTASAQPDGDGPEINLTAEKDGWQIYRNPRFGMVLPVPPAITAQRPPDNGGGQAFRSADGKAELLTWGSFNIDGIGDVAKRWEAALIEPGRTITYKRKTDKWFVISGIRKDGSAFYERYDADEKYCAGWLVTHPQEEEKKWSALIERISKGYAANLGKGVDTLE